MQRCFEAKVQILVEGVNADDVSVGMVADAVRECVLFDVDGDDGRSRAVGVGMLSPPRIASIKLDLDSMKETKALPVDAGYAVH